MPVCNEALMYGISRFFIPSILGMIIPILLLRNSPQLVLMYVPLWTVVFLLYAEKIISIRLLEIEKRFYMKDITNVEDDIDLVLA